MFRISLTLLILCCFQCFLEVGGWYTSTSTAGPTTTTGTGTTTTGTTATTGTGTTTTGTTATTGTGTTTTGPTATGTGTTVLADSCYREYSTAAGQIKSPLYPLAYPNNADCTYVISGAEGANVVLEFEEFETEEQKDFVNIYEGMPTGNIELSGNNLNPKIYQNSEQDMTILFKSDNQNTFRGFRANFWHGGYFTGRSGEVHSANYPNNYPNNADYRYLITTDIGYGIMLTFDVFNTEERYDYITIYDGKDESAKTIARFSGTKSTPFSIASTGNSLLIKMTTDSSTTSSGFHAKYKRICQSENHNGSSGIIHSSNYPNTYPADVDCSYLITAQPGYVVVLTFSTFSTKKDRDFVMIYDGPSRTNEQIAILSGTPQLEAYMASGRQMLIVFTSGSETEGQGFEANYQQFNLMMFLKNLKLFKNNLWKIYK